jgi:hypothetical protein
VPATLVQILAIDATPWLAAAFVVLALLAAAIPGAFQNRLPLIIGLLALTAAAVLLPLFGYWLAGRTHPNAIAGLLPWNDAAGYYGCALSVLDGEGLSAFCQRRPAYSLYLAGLLRVAGSELQLALLLQAALNGAAIFVTAYGAARRWGAGAGLISVAILASFMATVSVTTLTENLGFVLGAGGLVLFLSGTEHRSGLLLAAGAFVLSVALNARAGAFFVLPLLVLWPFLATDMLRRSRWWLAGLIAVSAAAGFLPGTAIVALLGGAKGELHSNFSYTLYGLAAGGERWTYALTRLPGATSEQIFSAALELIRVQPQLLLAGLAQGFLEYLQRLLIYIPWTPARVVLGAFWLWGIATLVRRQGTDFERALALLFLGVVLSAPILSIEGETRVFAATIAIDGLLAALGFARFAEVFPGRRAMIWGGAVLIALALPNLVTESDPRAWGGAMVAGGLLALAGQRGVRIRAHDRRLRASEHRATGGVAGVGAAWLMTLVAFALVLVAPWLARGSHVPAENVVLPAACTSGSPVLARLGRDSPVVKIGLDGAGELWPVVASQSAFRAGLHPLTHQYAELGTLGPGMAIVFLHDLTLSPDAAGRTGVLVGNGELVPSDGRLYRLCVADNTDVPLPGARRIVSVHPVGGRNTVLR